jgi:hypothetical protein
LYGKVSHPATLKALYMGGAVALKKSTLKLKEGEIPEDAISVKCVDMANSLKAFRANL